MSILAIGSRAAARWSTNRVSSRSKRCASKAGRGSNPLSLTAEAGGPFGDLLVGDFREQNIGGADRLTRFELVEFFRHRIARPRDNIATGHRLNRLVNCARGRGDDRPR